MSALCLLASNAGVCAMQVCAWLIACVLTMSTEGIQAVMAVL
jgi:hypothetical protein